MLLNCRPSLQLCATFDGVSCQIHITGCEAVFSCRAIGPLITDVAGEEHNGLDGVAKAASELCVTAKEEEERERK